MGKEHDKLADVDDKKKHGSDVDTDAEHKKETSRKASNADLKRNAKESAGIKGYGSAQLALKFMSAEYHRWAHELDELRGADTSGEAGAEPIALSIEGIFAQAMSDAHHAAALIASADKSVLYTLSPEVRMAQGAAFILRTHLEPASQWLASHGHDILPLRQLTELVEGFTAKLGYDQPLDQIRKAPEEDEDALRKEVALSEIDALESSIASVEAGNADDAMRITIHARTLHNFATEHGIRIKSAAVTKRLQKMHGKVHEMVATNSSLGEASNHLRALLQH